MRNRSWRRSQRERVIIRTERWMKDNGLLDPRHLWEGQDTNLAIRKNATTPHPCSGYCCGNPRKWFKQETQQEKRSRLKGHDLY